MKNKLGTVFGALYGAVGSAVGSLNLGLGSSCDPLSGSFSLVDLARNYELSSVSNTLTYLLFLPALIPGVVYESITKRVIADNHPVESALVLAVSAAVLGTAGNMLQRGIRRVRGKQELGSSPSK